MIQSIGFSKKAFWAGLSVALAALTAQGDPAHSLIYSTKPALPGFADLAAKHELHVKLTHVGSDFSEAGLGAVQSVVLLDAEGDFLNADQQAALQGFVENGGGLVVVHGSANAAPDWEWFGAALGARVASVSAAVDSRLQIEDQSLPMTSGLADRVNFSDLWPSFTVNPRGEVHVIASLDGRRVRETSMGADHPIIWSKPIGKGNLIYMGIGGSDTARESEVFQNLLAHSAKLAGAPCNADLGATIRGRFKRVVLEAGAKDPMELSVAADGRVFYVERAGKLKVWSPETKESELIGELDVFTGLEDGLLGMTLDPNFINNHWVYLYYSPPGISENRLARFTIQDNKLDHDSEKVLIRVETQRDECCHAGGSVNFGPDGLLYVSAGDNTNPFASDGYSPSDERPGRSPWDAQRSSGNRNDLRGKILRIRPLDDGTFEIPEGNLFPADGSAGRPEVYVMGNRNPFRISIDSETGWLYWGEVGPDAGSFNENRGPAGHDEINQAREAGNFGWPFFVGRNFAYKDYNFETKESGAEYDPKNPINDSPNNTGMRELPPAQPAFIYYPHAPSARFPELASGGRTAMAGPVYHREKFESSEIALPGSYDNSLFIYEWTRSWIKQVILDERGYILKINDFLPGKDFKRPMDMELGPDGALYVIQWGTNWSNNNDTQILRIEYHQE